MLSEIMLICSVFLFLSVSLLLKSFKKSKVTKNVSKYSLYDLVHVQESPYSKYKHQRPANRDTLQTSQATLNTPPDRKPFNDSFLIDDPNKNNNEEFSYMHASVNDLAYKNHISAAKVIRQEEKNMFKSLNTSSEIFYSAKGDDKAGKSVLSMGFNSSGDQLFQSKPKPLCSNVIYADAEFSKFNNNDKYETVRIDDASLSTYVLRDNHRNENLSNRENREEDVVTDLLTGNKCLIDSFNKVANMTNEKIRNNPNSELLPTFGNQQNKDDNAAKNTESQKKRSRMSVLLSDLKNDNLPSIKKQEFSEEKEMSLSKDMLNVSLNSQPKGKPDELLAQCPKSENQRSNQSLNPFLTVEKNKLIPDRRILDSLKFNPDSLIEQSLFTPPKGSSYKEFDSFG